MWGVKFNVVVCDRLLIEEILIHNNDNLGSGGPYTAWNRLILDSLGATNSLRLASGTQWRSCREALSPVSMPLNTRQMAPVVSEGCTRLVHKIAKVAESQTTVDVHKLYVDFTMETIVASAFGESAEGQSVGEGSELLVATNDFIAKFNDCMSSSAEELTVFLSHFPLARPLLVRLAGRLAVTRAHRHLKEAGCRLVEARKALASPPQDILQLLLETSLSSYNGECNTAAAGDDDEEEKLSDQQVVCQAIEFLISGQETTAAGLASVSYQLAVNTRVQDRVQEEIDALFNKRTKKSLYDASLRLPYLDSVIQETLRLRPPTPMIIRHCEADIELERHTLPKGADVYIPTFLVHKSPDLWPQPYRFDPGRFSNEERMKREAMTHMPFGAGPHVCLGAKFALAQMKMALVSILHHYTFVLSPKTEVPLRIAHSAAADVPLNGVVLLILPRNTTATPTL
ncbi:Cytochrome P450 3A29 [Geodia barretti]|uniref:Cytochrome P450 3A29 n=2 Tax=Geodia barretti TaxID=519541 RepID=A0AA35X6K7_GEOBA|nr:Cytochrome P450 3A29 [Geodia barretti]